MSPRKTQDTDRVKKDLCLSLAFENGGNKVETLIKVPQNSDSTIAEVGTHLQREIYEMLIILMEQEKKP